MPDGYRSELSHLRSRLRSGRARLQSRWQETESAKEGARSDADAKGMRESALMTVEVD